MMTHNPVSNQEGSKPRIVPESHVGLLYIDGRFDRILDPGAHRLDPERSWWARRFDRGPQPTRRVRLVDLRERSITIKGQEILTSDKVAIRVSLLVYLRVTDPELALHAVASFEDRVYEDVQLAARRFLASRELDAILTDRNDISDAVRDQVREAAAGYGVEVLRADVKDLVFPGNLRTIMNQVLETERRAEARLVEAKREAEAELIRAQAEQDQARIAQTTADDAARAQAQLEADINQLTLQADVATAQALAANPGLLRLRELQALQAMAAAGARFTIGLDRGSIVGPLAGEPIDVD